MSTLDGNTQGVKEARKRSSFEYPLNNPDDYKGRLLFTVLQEPETELGNLADFSADAVKKVTESFTGLLEGGGVPSKEEAKTNLDEFSGKAKNVPVRGSQKPKRTDKYVSIYLPQGLQFRDNVAYENVDLGVAGAGAEAGLRGGVGALQGMVETGMKTLSQSLTGAGGGDLAKLGAVRLASKVPGFGDELGAASKLAGRVTSNPNTRVLFKQVNMREFSFTFKFLPSSQKEAEEVKNIIKLFREELYPEDITIPFGAGPNASRISLGYKFPNRFQIDVLYDGQRVSNKIKPCYLRDVSTNYNNTAMSFHSDGNFTEIELTLSFQESKTLNRQDIVDGY